MTYSYNLQCNIGGGSQNSRVQLLVLLYCLLHALACAGAKLIFRFEPFILAAECRDMSTAQQLVSVAREAGFRESGVTATKARIIAGIRCSLRLEVKPVAILLQLSCLT